MTTQPQTIALVITELEVGGAERCLTHVARGLDRERFSPMVVTLGSSPRPPRQALLRELEQDGIPVHCLGFRRPWQLPSAVTALSRLFRQTRPALIQSMLFHANVVTHLARALGERVPWCAGIRVADPSRLRQRVEGWSLKKASQVVCVSRRVADYAGQRMHVPPERRCVIPNGVDVAAVSSVASTDLVGLGVPVGRRVISCVARLAPQKGIDRLLRAAARFLPELPDHDLLLVGDGSLEARLRQLADTLGIARRTHFCGWQPHTAGILRASELLVLPSHWEGMPNVLLEAMACGRPVVCTPVEGVLEVLDTLADQQVAPADDPQVFANKILTIINRPALAEQLGQCNRRRVQSHFSLEVVLHRYAMLYTQLLQGARTH